MAGGATGGAIEGGHTLCGSTESRTKTSAAGLGAWRLSRRRVATSPPRFRRFVSPPAAPFWVRLSVEPQRACPPSMAPPVAPPTIFSVPLVAFRLRQGCSRQTCEDHVMVRVMPGVPDRDIQEQTSVCPRDVVGPGPHSCREGGDGVGTGGLGI